MPSLGQTNHRQSAALGGPPTGAKKKKLGKNWKIVANASRFYNKSYEAATLNIYDILYIIRFFLSQIKVRSI